jgi:hypothetical protein
MPHTDPLTTKGCAFVAPPSPSYSFLVGGIRKSKKRRKEGEGRIAT